MKGADWDARYAASPLLWGAAPNRFVEERCRLLPVGTALDLACGEGRNALWLAARGWRVTGIDFSSVAIERARAAAVAPGQTVEFICDDILTTALPEAAFDLVLLAYIQLPADERRLLLSRAAAAVAEGGMLVLVGHDRTNHTEGHGGPTDPSLLWTTDEIVAALSDFAIEEAITALRPVDGAPRPAIDTIVRARRAIGYDGDTRRTEPPVCER
jgi:SAM-dependent methyltransferase